MFLGDFTKLCTFVTVVRRKSFSNAAELLGVSQPTVTQQIKVLEAYFQTQLFIRSRKGIYLTTKGEEIYTLALELEQKIKKADQMIKKRFNCTSHHKRIKQ